MPEPRTYTLPRSLEVIASTLRSAPAPGGAFDPQGEWTHSYQTIALEHDPARPEFKGVPMGFLRLLRRPVGDDALELEVEQLLRTPGRTERLRATVTCAAETLSTPRRWRIECSLLADDYPIPNAQAAQRGEARDGLIRRQALVGGKPSGRMRSFPAPARFTAGWCLFDALQRLPGDDARVDDFDLLEDLQVVKSGQRLAFRQTTALDWAGRQVLLHGFEQLGSGLLPYTWWLDDARRVVAAVGGMKALVWNPSADATERQP